MSRDRGWGKILRPRLFAFALPVFAGPVTAKEIRLPLVARAFAVGSFPGTDRSSSALVDLFRSRIGLVIAAVRLFAAAGPPDPAAVVAVAGFVVAGSAADSVCPVCPAAAAMEKGRVVAPVAFCFLVRRSSSLRNRSSLSLLCSAVPP